MSSTATSTVTAASTVATYWCYDCDMSISLLPSFSPLCPHSPTHSLHSMDLHPSDNHHQLLRVLIDHLRHSKPSSSLELIPTVEITGEMIKVDVELGCVVCKDGFGAGELVKELPCKHLYHSECIIRWLSVRSSCPLCRFELPQQDCSEPELIWSRESISNLREMTEDRDLFQFVLRQSGVRVMEDLFSLLTPLQAGEEAEIGMV